MANSEYIQRYCPACGKTVGARVSYDNLTGIPYKMLCENGHKVIDPNGVNGGPRIQ